MRAGDDLAGVPARGWELDLLGRKVSNLGAKTVRRDVARGAADSEGRPGRKGIRRRTAPAPFRGTVRLQHSPAVSGSRN
jgi:hypothetical protein